MDKLQLMQAIKELIDQGDEEALGAFEDAYKAIKRKSSGKSRTYINGLTDYQGEQTGENEYRASIKLGKWLMNPLQITHGGIIATFADTAMGTLVYHVLPEGYASVTGEMKVNFIKPGVGEKLYCHCKLLHKGRKTSFVTADITDDDHNTVAFATGTFFTVKAE